MYRRTGLRHMGNLSIKLLGKDIKNPVMNASGTLGYGKEITRLWNIETLGVYVTKGLSIKPHHGNPPPRVWEEKQGMINSIGLQNVGIECFFSEYFPFFKKKKTPIIVNFFGFTEEEYIACARMIEPHPLIVALEMNLSCPNIKKGGISFGKEAGGVYDIVRKVKAVTEIPVIAKLTPEVKDIVEIARAAYEGGADGFTLINTMPALALDKEKRLPVFTGGFSGPALKPIALKAVYSVYKEVPVPIIGAGGIIDYKDAIDFFAAGATAIQVGTATFIDPYSIPKIIQGIKDHMKEYRISTIEHITGCAHE